MKQKYKFVDDYLGLSESKIHFLRNRFEVDSCDYSAIKKCTLKQGKSIKNAFLLLIIGVLLFLLGIWLMRNVVLFLMYGTGTIYVEETIFPVFLILMGAFSIYKSLKKELILQVELNQKTHKFSLSAFQKSGELNDLIDFLKSKTELMQNAQLP